MNFKIPDSPAHCEAEGGHAHISYHWSFGENILYIAGTGRGLLQDLFQTPRLVLTRSHWHFIFHDLSLYDQPCRLSSVKLHFYKTDLSLFSTVQIPSVLTMESSHLNPHPYIPMDRLMGIPKPCVSAWHILREVIHPKPMLTTGISTVLVRL